MDADWTKAPSLAGIDPAKLAMLQSLAAQGSQKGQSEMLPFLMAAASSSQKNGTQFSRDEIDLIVDVLKTGKSSEEIARIDRMMQIMKLMKK